MHQDPRACKLAAAKDQPRHAILSYDETVGHSTDHRSQMTKRAPVLPRFTSSRTSSNYVKIMHADPGFLLDHACKFCQKAVCN